MLRAVLAANAMGAALALAFVVALTVPLYHLENEAMVYRFPAFKLSAAVVPTVRRRRFLPTGERGHAAGGPLLTCERALCSAMRDAESVPGGRVLRIEFDAADGASPVLLTFG